jgi:hypothetical protein
MFNIKTYAEVANLTSAHEHHSSRIKHMPSGEELAWTLDETFG